MVRFECDSCHRLKQEAEVWILGFAAEMIGVSVARREISIASAWDDARAVDRLAVHFCSDECQQRYMGELFGAEIETEVIEEEVAVIPRTCKVQKRVVRTIPGAQVETTIKSRKRDSRARKTSRKAS